MRLNEDQGIKRTVKKNKDIETKLNELFATAMAVEETGESTTRDLVWGDWTKRPVQKKSDFEKVMELVGMDKIIPGVSKKLRSETDANGSGWSFALNYLLINKLQDGKKKHAKGEQKV